MGNLPPLPPDAVLRLLGDMARISARQRSGEWACQTYRRYGIHELCPHHGVEPPAEMTIWPDGVEPLRPRGRRPEHRARFAPRRPETETEP